MDDSHAITVLLADDHPTFRLGLRALLSQADSVAVVAEAGTGPEALDRWQALRPRVLEAVDGLHVVLYRGMGEEERAQACRLLVQMCANLRAELGDPALPAPQTAAETAGNC